MDHPLRPLCTAWWKVIQKARDHKKKVFQDDADECMSFFNGPYDFLYDGKGTRRDWSSKDNPETFFRACVNKAAEMQQLFSPVLYHDNPNRLVNPREVPSIPIEFFGNPQDQLAQAYFLQVQGQVQQQRVQDETRARLLNSYLNYTPKETDGVTHARRAIDEALLKGMGVRWTELYTFPMTGRRVVGSFYDTIDNLFLDPDVEEWEHCQWICKRCVHPVWVVEKEYGLAPGSLRGSHESLTAQGAHAANADGDWKRKRGDTNDLIVYYKVYSRMGLGGRMPGVPKELQALDEAYGDHVFLAIAPDIPYPLNIPPELMQSAQDEEIRNRLQWQTPFYLDDQWPATFYSFHRPPRQLYGMSHLRPGLGELRFLNWAFSFLMGKIKNTSRDFIAVTQDASEEFKNKILHGRDLTLLEISRSGGQQTIDQVVQFLQHPQLNQSIWDVINAVADMFDKRVGLTELMYGQTSRQMRSASEAELKSNQLAVRPDDMARKVEAAESELATKEAMAARWHLQPEDLMPILGPVGTQFWQQLVSTADLDAIIHQYEFTVEAGSARRPNKEGKQQAINTGMQTLFPFYSQLAMMGMVDQFNALVVMWCEANEFPKPEKLLIQSPQMMMAQMQQQQMQAQAEGSEQTSSAKQSKA